MLKSKNLFDLSHSLGAPLFQASQYPWEVLEHISHFIEQLGPTLDPARFEEIALKVWVAKSAVRPEKHTSELQSHTQILYAAICW